MIVKIKDQINKIWEYRDQTTPWTPSMDGDDDTYEKYSSVMFHSQNPTISLLRTQTETALFPLFVFQSEEVKLRK